MDKLRPLIFDPEHYPEDAKLVGRKMPKQKPGRSIQEVCTPPELIQAVLKKLGLGMFSIDLAASPENAVTHQWYTEEDDSLIQNWIFSTWAWCNPPYSNIEPWVAKASMEAPKGAHVAMLVPASVGSNWWAQWVDGKAYVLLMNGRVTFVGHNSPYPKDTAILLYAPFLSGGYSVWKWQDE